VSVALVIQHAKRVNHIILPRLASPALLHSSTFSQKTARLPGWVSEHKMCVLIFSATFIWDMSHSVQRDSTINVHTSCVKHPLFLPDSNETDGQLVEALRYKSEGRWQSYPLHKLVIYKFWAPQPPGPQWASIGIALPFHQTRVLKILKYNISFHVSWMEGQTRCS
jgi:hypothetical protein